MTDAAIAVDAYIAERLVPEDEALAAAAASDVPHIQVSRAQGKLLMLLARMMSAKRILEVGTLAGYSTIWLARGMAEDGELVTLEIDPKHAEIARANLERAGLASRVSVRLGPALETMATLQGTFDLVFIDADKTNNAHYFDRALALSHPGTVIVVDNVVRKGAVTDASSTDASVLGTRALFDRISSEPRVSATAIQTVGDKGWDGFAIARVI